MGDSVYSALAKDQGGQLSREHVTDALRAAGIGVNGEVTDLLWTEMGLPQNAPITQVPLSPGLRASLTDIWQSNRPAMD